MASSVLLLVLALLALVVLAVVLLAVALVARDRRARRDREDILRAGPGEHLTAQQAASRGGGRSSWMRPAGS